MAKNIESDFERIATDLINQIADKLEEYGYDVDINGGILYIEADSGTYVINKHAPTLQIWLSSPISGAKHFELKDNEWVCTRGNGKLLELIGKELR